jgi:hypothetical protein
MGLVVMLLPIALDIHLLNWEVDDKLQHTAFRQGIGSYTPSKLHVITDSHNRRPVPSSPNFPSRISSFHKLRACSVTFRAKNKNN